MTNMNIPPDQSLRSRASTGPSSCKTDRVPEQGWSVLLSGANAVRSLALAGGVALHAINVYIATTILPSVVRDIGGLDLYAWNTTVFVVASILGSALASNLLKQAGPRGAYAVAAGTFAVGSLICAASPSMSMLLVGRLVQGLGGGFLFALAYAMIRLVFDERLWPRAMALVSGMWGVATLVGPAIGGLFAEFGVWRAAFWSLAPASVFFAVLAMLVLPKSHIRADRRMAVPIVQLVVLVVAVLAISAGSASSSLIWNIAGGTVAAIFIVLLVIAEGRSRSKLLPSGALVPSTEIFAVYVTMSLLAVPVTSGEIFLPLFLQVIHHQSALAAGYISAVMAAGWTLGSVLGSGSSLRKSRRLIVSGPLLQIIGMAVLTVLISQESLGNWSRLVPICAALAAIGLGVGLSWPHLLTRVLKLARPDEAELAGATITTVQLFATAMGAAFAGMIANAGGLVDPGGTAGTAHAALYLLGTFTVAPILCIITARRVVDAMQGGG